MRIVFGADYKGIVHRDALVAALRELGDVVDVCALDPALTDYVEVAEQVAKTLVKPVDLGVMVCGTGIGISIVANKHDGVAAARCLSVQDAVDSKLVNNANVLCLSANTPIEQNIEIITAFFGTQFPGDEKRTKRLHKIAALEQRNFK
jgi:ribose 5-phosphate isomerase B